MNKTIYQISYLLKKYGQHFFRKCKHYKTAKYNGAYVSLISFDINDLSFYIEEADKKRSVVCVTELDDYVL
jgi:hypothetical protein